ncbi:hypothetical protein NQ314_011224 [Rhamnusium bicolor]|uniref:Nuclear receptor subfamily 2 group E member 1 n=1 Tax=Rhamnusium bicolor TaxID=1586634 RepID=A0AAV8XJI1_9CUCU|nr:hypothetical protein NQ314_011224 [Rhamnusium bicolor]
MGICRILDIPCKVCGDYSSGKHYNIFACDGCAGFFKRSIRRNRQYICKEDGDCVIDKTHRNQCRACRLRRCQEAGMNKDGKAVQHERGPRNATLRRQMNHFYTEARDRIVVGPAPPGVVLNLAVPKSPGSSRLNGHYPIIHPTGFICNTAPSMPRLPTTVPLPEIVPTPTPSPAIICEAAARLLFMNIQWAKNLPPFTMLQLSDQLLMLEERWRELFVLGAAQFLPLTEMSSLVDACGILARDTNHTVFLQNVREFQEVLANIRHFQLDQHEFACLRAIVLFNTTFEKFGSSTSPPQTETNNLSDPAEIASVQDDTHLTLNRYINIAYPTQPLRFGKVLLLLPSLRRVSSDTIEELFFRKTIGNIPIVRIICDVYIAQSVNYL